MQFRGYGDGGCYELASYRLSKDSSYGSASSRNTSFIAGIGSPSDRSLYGFNGISPQPKRSLSGPKFPLRFPLYDLGSRSVAPNISLQSANSSPHSL